MERSRRGSRSWVRFPVTVVALAAVSAACGDLGNLGAQPAPAPRADPPATTVPTTAAPPTTQARPPAPPKATPGWTAVYRTARAVVTEKRTIRLTDGTSVSLVRFLAGSYRVNLHAGSQDPPTGGWGPPPWAAPAIKAPERLAVIGAFNAGFKADAAAGGTEIAHHVLVPLVAGDASLVVDRNGSVRIGVWGHGLPVPGEAVVSVRQNLTPLISGGRVNPAVADVAAWGAELGGVAATARSAVGTDAAGDLVYAGSMAALPADLASALRSAGVTNAMELDINPYWVQADLASSPGGALDAAVVGQQRPADTYLVGWIRDFFTVLARTPRATG